ncbi:hypothetical protein Slin15195_G025320 [Septoria linicola]|uniref:Pathway-specific nitrogen regulator n=1 Tax=Septoria linicola TaxID=215465 RepID=A0A9Q9AN90_9PEZI|nr:hypothetical protein Slin14017_G024400 [Septoria linicola]USW49213.1 hypothetical protein Slin15195_G025320 [Septoria linicola]
MARPTKTQQFAIWEDDDDDNGGIPPPPRTPESTHSTATDEQRPTTLLGSDSAYSQQQKQRRDTFDGTSAGHDAGEEDDDDVEGDDDDIDDTVLHHQLDDADDDERQRRESAFTATSVSSLPDSAFETDYNRGAVMQMHTPYTPPMIRPSFRRPQSVKKMQMSSPAPSERSLRRSILSPPPSARSSIRGTCRRQKWVDGDAEKKEYPLVLLHLTLLPVELRWSRQSMDEVLPASTLEALQLLKSKVSETIIQRGILIPHPRDDYELLEERLLEALELKKERISRGHFRARDSTSSADSGVGSSVEGVEDDQCCDTCHAKIVDSAVSAGGRKWSIKVFAANGLMRASAWTAAWSEMERVDVEILPWIDEELRRTLDVRALQDAADERKKQEEEAVRISEAEEQFRNAQQERARARNVQRPHAEYSASDEYSHVDSDIHTDKGSDLPRVYQPKDIPLSLLLKNYIYLVAQDKRNIAIFALAALALVVSLRASLLPGLDVSALPPVCENIQAHPPVLQQAPTSSRANSIYTADFASVQSSMSEQDAATATATATAREKITDAVESPMADLLSQASHFIDEASLADESLEQPVAHLQATKLEAPIPIEAMILETAQCPNMVSPSLVFGHSMRSSA